MRVDRHHDPHVLPVHVQRRADRHRVDGVVLPRNQLRLAHDAVDGYVESVVVLRREPEDAQPAVLVAGRLLPVRVPQEPPHRELAALDPDVGRLVDAVEDNGAAVGGRDDDARVVGRGARPRAGLERAVEELVEALELLDREEHLGEVELVELDEGDDLRLRRRVVVFLALLDAHALEELADCCASVDVPDEGKCGTYSASAPCCST